LGEELGKSNLLDFSVGIAGSDIVGNEMKEIINDNPKIEIWLGDCLKLLKDIPSESVDAIVSDPPYDLVSIVKRFGREGSAPAQYGKDGAFARVSKGFMGKEWDGTGIAFNVDLWKECLRVLKPGGHLIAFGGTRTYHRMACAIEDAGFEVRDMIEWIYSSGFPKSLNVGKAVDKLQGNEREVVGEREVFGTARKVKGKKGIGASYTSAGTGVEFEEHTIIQDTKGNSEWEGFGTALKPSHEPIILARKPLSEKTVVENVLKHKTGALDIDGCRIPTSDTYSYEKCGGSSFSVGKGKDGTREYPAENNPQGRFPANIICTGDALNDGVMTKSQQSNRGLQHSGRHGGLADIGGNLKDGTDTIRGHADAGSKSRYFDIDCWAEKWGILQFPKASKGERNKGCEGLEEKKKWNKGGVGTGISARENIISRNIHPTVKPVHLMSWLVRLVTPPNGTCLDPFAGSFTTGVACKMLGRNFIGIEKEAEYFAIGKARIEGVKTEKTLF